MKQIIGLLSGFLVIVLIAVGGYYLSTRVSCAPEQAETRYGIEINGSVFEDGDAAALKTGANELKLVRPAGSSGTVKLEVHRNPEADFEFKADGKTMNFATLDNVTAAFELTTGENGNPILTIEEGITMTKILQALFPSNEITDVPESADALGGGYFYLLADFGGENTVKVELIFGKNSSVTITLDPPQIIF